MAEKMEIKVDPIGAMRNTRQTFSDPLCFVDELTQNAQRAGAGTIYWHVRCEKGQIDIKDDGCGCDDFQMLFTQAISGWSEEVKRREAPFGAGFFSTIVVSDDIRVRSGGKSAVFDVEKMFRESRTDVVTLGDVKPRPGFEMSLRKLRVAAHDLWRVEDRIAKVAKYAPIKVWLNGKVCFQTTIDKPEGSEKTDPFMRKFDLGGMRGFLRPSSWGGVETYHCGRSVETLYGLRGCTGRVEIDLTVMSPRAPDRKAWIRDEMFKDGFAILEDEARKVLLKVALNGDNEQIESLGEAILAVVGIDDVAPALRFDMVGMAQKVDVIDSSTDEARAKSKTLAELMSEMAKAHSQNLPDVVLQDQAPSVYAELSMIPAPKPAAQPSGLKLVDLAKLPVLFWVDEIDAMTYTDKIREAKFYSVPVLILTNKVQREAVVKKLTNALHIRDLKKGFRLKADLKDRNAATMEEVRALKLMRAVKRMFEMEGEIEICTFRTWKQHLLNDKDTIKNEEFSSVALAYDKNVHLQRALLPLDVLRGVQPEDPLTNADRAFVMKILVTLSHELVHVLCGLRDEAIGFRVAQDLIEEKVIESIFTEEFFAAPVVQMADLRGAVCLN